MSGYASGTAARDMTRFRRMVAEPGLSTYQDSDLVEVVSRYPLPDAAGEWPYLASGSVNTEWVATYDLAAAAADVWAEKATNYVDNFDFTADGSTFNKSQQYEQCSKEERRWRSRRSLGSHTMRPYPGGTVDSWIGNLAESD